WDRMGSDGSYLVKKTQRAVWADIRLLSRLPHWSRAGRMPALRSLVVRLLVIAVVGVAWVTSGEPSAATRGRAALVREALLPTSIGFWNTRHGLIATGTGCQLFGGSWAPCMEGTVSVTTDGGRSSRVLVRSHLPVDALAVAGAGQ